MVRENLRETGMTFPLINNDFFFLVTVLLTSAEYFNLICIFFHKTLSANSTHL